MLFRGVLTQRKNMMQSSTVIKLFPLVRLGYEDYTTHKDEKRRQNYINRHSNEDWSRTNLESAAWMSRYILWEKPSLREAVANANRMYRDVKFSLK